MLGCVGKPNEAYLQAVVRAIVAFTEANYKAVVIYRAPAPAPLKTLYSPIQMELTL